MPTVAPKERVNITYQPATGNVAGGVELPLKILLMGDLIGRADERPVEDRKPINVDASNLDSVLKEQKLSIAINVPDKLSDAGGELPMKLKFDSIKDFDPAALANQVPELRKLVELRTALSALKGPLGNFPAFRKRLQSLLGDEKAREVLRQELGIKQ